MSSLATKVLRLNDVADFFFKQQSLCVSLLYQSKVFSTETIA